MLPLAVGINPYKNKQQNGEAPQRRAPITKERQGDTNHRHQP